jgi:hypothetical protein
VDEKTFVEMVITWLTGGGAGIALSTAVTWLCKAWPGFQEVWTALTAQLKQGIMFVVGVGLSAGVYWLATLTPYLEQPITPLGWIVALAPVAFIEFGIGELFYKQVTKRKGK